MKVDGFPMEVLLNEQTWFKGKKKNLEHEIGAALPPLQHADTL